MSGRSWAATVASSDLLRSAAEAGCSALVLCLNCSLGAASCDESRSVLPGETLLENGRRMSQSSELAALKARLKPGVP